MRRVWPKRLLEPALAVLYELLSILFRWRNVCDYVDQYAAGVGQDKVALPEVLAADVLLHGQPRLGDEPLVFRLHIPHLKVQQQALHRLAALADAGLIVRQPLEPLAYLLSGAMNEAALWIAQSDHPEQALAEVTTALEHLLHALRQT